MKEFRLTPQEAVFWAPPNDSGGMSRGGERKTSVVVPAESEYRISPLIIEGIVTLKHGDPGYPLVRSFERDYEDAVSDDYQRYAFKHALACALIADGRYQDLRFLVNNFAPEGEKAEPGVEELRSDLQLRVRQALLKRGDREETKKAEGELSAFAEEVAEGETLDAQEFREIVGLFGSSRVVDILYRSRPEFRGVPVDRVTSILANYLGDFLVTRGKFKPEDLETGIQYLSDPSFQEGLVEVMKDSGYAFYVQSRRSGTPQTTPEIFDDYVAHLIQETAKFGNDNLNQAVMAVQKHFDSLSEYQKPSRIVDDLKAGREFPDVGQLINLKEIRDKRRMLIADEMGLGKSASPILVKEALGIPQAVVIAPGNVIPTWQDYLSDKVENGKQVGYFKPGQAPRVLTVESQQSLRDPNLSAYDYILISQEKLRDGYTAALESVDYGMLVVDEIHKLKNLCRGKRAQNLLRLAAKVEHEDRYLVLLSGTPVPNKVKDVAIILKLLYPERFKEMDNDELVSHILWGDIVDLRRLLIPRMQMKSLTETIAMPELTQNIAWVEMSPEEREVYEILLEEDELEAKDKIRILRQFLLNPDLLEVSPGVESSKVKAVDAYLGEKFQGRDKVVMFVNGYITDVIRGGKAILTRLHLPREVKVQTIMGGVKTAERVRIQKELATTDGKRLVVVSGQTADVGVDFSPAQAVAHYNEPWTEYEKRQQVSRVFREGLVHPLEGTTFIVRDSIEEGIHGYIAVKYRAIEKLLRGIPISELERRFLERTEKQNEPDLEVNPELAEYYFSSWDKMLKIFAHTKEIGEKEFLKFIADYGRDYAGCYVDLGARSYQANACRISGTIIDRLVKDAAQDPRNVQIIDIASGPQMLKRHIAEPYQDQITSLDINPHHFKGEEGKMVVGSFLALPFDDESFDYANLSLAWHYTIFRPSRGEYERIKVLAEMNRVLRPGGKAVINLMYNLDIKDIEKFRKAVEILGFRIVNEYSGEVIVGNQFKSRVITLEKQRDIDGDSETLAVSIGKENFRGLKFAKTDQALKDSRRIVKEFEINGEMIAINFNQADHQVLREEEGIILAGEQLKRMYGRIRDIPKEEIISHGFVRILIGKRYVLFKGLNIGSGVVVVK